MMEYRGELVNGGISPEVAVIPLDLTPPLPPAGVTAVATDVGVKVFWDKNSEADLGGYRIYRRAADRDDYQLLGSVGPEYNLFVDQGAADGGRYYWAVSAVDQASPANESIFSREATIRN
jgi:fibronectin type 3 domain-containing protein